MAIESSICVNKGVPRLLINGKAAAPMAYITYFTERNHYKDFAEAGYELFSVPIFFGGRGINPTSHVSPISRGIYDKKERTDYGIMDKEMERILDAAPDAFVLPRVNIMMPEWWCQEHPEECNDIGIDGDPGRECFSSKKWREDAGNMLRQFIDHIEGSCYRDHIVGYQIADGRTEEWFPFDEQGSMGPAARKELQERYGENVSEIQRCRYVSETVAEAIEFFTEIVKECTGRRLVAGCFYGYTLEVTDNCSGHHAMEKLLRSDNVDFFCSPASYMGLRQPGKDWASMTALDSVRLHGKMCFTEYDTRTHLSRPLREARPDGCLPGTYEGGVWRGPDKPEMTRWLLKNNAARQLTHGYGSWWFDMWGGWFAEKEIMSDLSLYRSYALQSLEEEAEEENQVAVLVDEDAYSLLPRFSSAAGKCCYESREALGLAGVPYAIYEMGDFDAIRKNYKAFVFLAPVLTERMKYAVNCCSKDQIPYFVVDEEKVPLHTMELREFYRSNNVHIWCESDDVLYAGNGWLSIHAATAGKKQILLPESCRISDAGSTEEDMQEVTRDGNAYCFDMQEFETRIFRLSRIFE